MNKVGNAKFRINEYGDNELILLECNEKFIELTGLKDSYNTCILKEAFEDNMDSYYKDYKSFIDKDDKKYCIHLYKKSQRWLYTEFQNFSEKNEIEVLAFDISDYHQEVEKLKFKELGYKNFVERSHGICFQRIIKPFKQNIFTAGNFENIVGHSKDVGTDSELWLNLVHPEDAEWVRKECDKLFSEEGYNAQYEYRIIHSNGEVRWIRTYDNNFYSADRVYQIIQGLMFDVTEIKNREFELINANEIIRKQNLELELMTNTDMLTKALSRRKMKEIVEKQIENATKQNSFVLMLIDIDKFKNINDSYGHLAGDYILEQFSKIIMEQLRVSDSFARWGGEEFLIVFPDINIEEAIEIGNKLLEEVNKHKFMYEDNPIPVSFTGGLTSFEENKTFREMYSEVDKMLYKGKEQGRNRILVYKEE